MISLVQKPQKGEFHKIQKQAGIKVKITSPEFDKLPEKVKYKAPPRPKRATSPLANRSRQRNRGRSRRRNKSRKPEERSPQNKVAKSVEQASFFRKNKNRKKFGGKNRKPGNRRKKVFPREEDRPQRRKKPTYGGKGLTTNENGAPKMYKGPPKPKEGQSGKPWGGKKGGKRHNKRKPNNWRRGRRSSRSNQKRFSKK